jgi:hypothetical protein
MAIAGFLAFIGLLIAAYSILKKHERLLIRLRLSLFDKILLPLLMATIFISILISDYFRDFDEELRYYNIKIKLSFLVSSSSFLLLLLMLIYLLLKINLNRLNRKKLKLFNGLARELLNKKEYPTLIELLQKEYKRLIRISKTLSWSSYSKKKILSILSLKMKMPEIPPETRKYLEEYIEKEKLDDDKEDKENALKEKVKLLLKNILSEFKHYIGKAVRIFISESRDKGQELSRFILNLIFSDNDFVAKLVELKPDLELKLFGEEFDGYYEYVDIYFYEMIKNNRSILYYEIKNTQNIFDHRYSIPDENILLSYLLKDGRRAKKLEIERGISHFIYEYLDNLNKQTKDPYNYAFENFDDTKWRSPIFVSIRFIDIILSEYMHQGIECQYPLIFYRIITEKILENIKILEDVWMEPREWNSKYAYLLYEIVSTLEGMVFWITYKDSIPLVKLKDVDSRLESGNIIKACIIYLIKILNLISAHNKLPSRFQHYLTDIVLRLWFELRVSNSEECMKYSKVLLECIKENMKGFKKINENFYVLIRTSYENFDKIPYTLGARKRAVEGNELDKEITEYLNSVYKENYERNES